MTKKQRFSGIKPAVCVAVALAIASASAIAQQAGQNTQYAPSLVYRTGPYAPSGIGFADGFSDYMTLINERDGGLEGGVKIVVEECETGYSTDRGVECYERLKNNGATVVAPLSTGITYALIPRARKDGITIHTMGYGRADAAYGPAIDWVFMVPITYWSSTTVVLQHIADEEGGWDQLKGKTIVHAYHDSAYGREPIEVLRHYADKYGFKLELIPITPPGVEQRAVWTQIRRMQPDWISLFGWGVMNPTAIRTANSMGIDVSRIIGGIYSAQDDAVKPAGEAAKGYKAVSFHGVGGDYPVYQDLKQHVWDKGLGAGEAGERGGIGYNRGLLNAAYIVEAWRTAQKKFGNQPVNREQANWGFKHLDIDEQRTRELGLGGLMPPVKVTCENHEGGGLALIQQWDGKQWKQVTDFMKPNLDVVFPMYKESAEQFAKEQGIQLQDC